MCGPVSCTLAFIMDAEPTVQQLAERLGNATELPDGETARRTFPLEFWLGQVAERRARPGVPTDFPFGFSGWCKARQLAFYAGFVDGMQSRPYLYTLNRGERGTE